MASPIITSPIIRFGLFEVDLHARELRKSGIRIKIQEQPFHILAALLERPGEIVTREDLQKRLWSADTFVDFDLSLNSAVKKLRVALNDDSDNPRFIETLYRRGYRFIGPVNGVVVANGTTESGASPLMLQVAEPAAAPGTLPSRSVGRGKRWIVAAGVIALLIGAAFAWLIRPRSIQVLGYTQLTHDGRLKGATVTDGQRLYFFELQDDHAVAAQVSTSGGETAILPTPFLNLGIGDIAPDGSALLITNLKSTEASAALWTLPLPAGAPRRLSDLAPGAAAYSPDGTQIAFATGSDIYIAKSDGTGAHSIAKTTGRISAMPYWEAGLVSTLRFSPDGRRLRFAATELGSASQFLWEINRNGTGLRKMFPAWSASTSQCCGNWTPDGKYYVFQNWQRGKMDIWALPEEASWFGDRPKPVQLTNGPLEFSFPVPSKDGKKIFIVGSQSRAELQRFDRKLGWTQYFKGASAIDLAFSPDGEWVAYVSMPDFTLWRSRIDGSSPLQLTSSSLYAELPRWSPDGRQIVFMGRTDRTNFRAHVISANGGDLRELIPGAPIGFDPGWSSDGKSIILTLTDPLAPSGAGISILDLESGKVSSVPGSEAYFSPRPSPDSRLIAAITRNSDRLVLFDLETQTWRDLTAPTFGPIGYPNWSHDGQYIYFDTAYGEERGIFRVRVSDGKLERVTSLEGVQRFKSNFGPWSGLAPDDTPIVARDISSQEIYALEWKAP